MAGSTFEGWSGALIFAVAFIVIFGGVVIGGMNDLHSKSYEIEGLPTDDLSQQIEGSQQTLDEKIKGGDISFLSAVGIALGTSWDILISLFKMFVNFITGGWIDTVVFYMKLPSTVAWAFKAIYFLALGIILLRILFKIEV